MLPFHLSAHHAGFWALSLLILPAAWIRRWRNIRRKLRKGCCLCCTTNCVAWHNRSRRGRSRARRSRRQRHLFPHPLVDGLEPLAAMLGQQRHERIRIVVVANIGADSAGDQFSTHRPESFFLRETSHCNFDLKVAQNLVISRFVRGIMFARSPDAICAAPLGRNRRGPGRSPSVRAAALSGAPPDW